mgnify:CR=1 FL=1
MALDHLVKVRQTIKRFRGTKYQIPLRIKSGMNPGQDVFLRFRREINQNVTTHHNIEFAKYVSLQQVQFLELHHGTGKRFTLSHFDFSSTRVDDPHDARFRLSYCSFNALFQTNIHALKDDMLSSHDLIIGTKSRTTLLFSHAMYSSVVAFIVYDSCQAYFNHL